MRELTPDDVHGAVWSDRDVGTLGVGDALGDDNRMRKRLATVGRAREQDLVLAVAAREFRPGGVHVSAEGTRDAAPIVDLERVLIRENATDRVDAGRTLANNDRTHELESERRRRGNGHLVPGRNV